MTGKHCYTAKVQYNHRDSKEVKVSFDNPVHVNDYVTIEGMDCKVFVVSHKDGGGSSIECDKM